MEERGGRGALDTSLVWMIEPWASSLVSWEPSLTNVDMRDSLCCRTAVYPLTITVSKYLGIKYLGSSCRLLKASLNQAERGSVAGLDWSLAVM